MPSQPTQLLGRAEPLAPKFRLPPPNSQRGILNAPCTVSEVHRGNNRRH
ncbi:MAG: hypothetical protein INR71_10495 [Terriglobus roseus]|nr:hypothetical protein [Terriglobus roseus]